jgi:hypothetical protein
LNFVLFKFIKSINGKQENGKQENGKFEKRRVKQVINKNFPKIRNAVKKISD